MRSKLESERLTDGVICLIKSVYIESFGGIKDKQIVFGDGLNVIYGGNEAGKTTVCAFIKAMLYGMDSSRKNDIRSVMRKRYMPADGVRMSGSMDISHYRISRVFGKTAKEDVTSVVDLENGENVTENIGEELLGVGEKAFSDLLFTESYSAKVTSTEELTEKLTKSGSDGGSYQAALKIIDTQRRKIVGKNGIAAYERELSELKNELCGVREIYDEYLQNQNMLNRKKREYSQLCDRKKYLGELIAEIEVSKKHSELSQLNKECERLKCCTESEEQAEKSGKMPTPYAFLTAVKKAERIDGNGIFALMMTLGTAAALTAVLGLLCKTAYFSIAAVLALTAFFTGLRVRKNEKSKSLNRVKTLLERYGVQSAEEYERVYNTEKEQRRQRLLNLNRELAVKESRRADLEKELGGAVADKIGFYNEYDIKNEYSAIDESISGLQRDILVLESKTEYEPQSGEKLQRQIEIKENRKNKMYSDLKCLDLVIETANEAVREYQNDFLPKLSGDASDIFRRITDGRYEKVFVGKNFDLAVGGKKIILDSAYLSNAAFDAAYLSLRLAMQNRIFADRESFLIMDDAFIQYDDERAQRAMEYLKKCKKQVIYFTCQKRFDKNIDL